MKSRLVTFAVAALLLVGCGNSNNGSASIQLPTIPNIQQIQNLPAHRNWGSYNVYLFTNGQWAPIISRSQTVGSLPQLGNNPVMIVHGLGSDIRSGRFTPLANALLQSGATGVVGFEYDTLDSISTNGGFLVDAYSKLTANAPTQTWRHVGHSMGALVSRVAFESGTALNVNSAGNKAVFAAGPHTGTPVADAIVSSPSLVQQAFLALVSNNQMTFTNVDFQQCLVTGQEISFVQISNHSQFTTALDVGASDRHPQWEYRTMGGTARGSDYQTLDTVLGVAADDGVVNLDSANTPVIGALQNATLSLDHTTIVQDNSGLNQIIQFLK